MLSHILMVQTLALAVIPVIGTGLTLAFGWRAIFVAITAIALLLGLIYWRWLPETLVPAALDEASVRVRGDAPLEVELPFPIPVQDLVDYTPAYTANPAVNAVPFVCAARPGLLRTADLPPLTPAGPMA